MEIVFIIFFIMALFYTFIYFLFIRKYKDLKKLFIINKLYDVFIIIPEIFIGFYSIVFFRILLLINFLSILYIIIKVFKNKEPNLIDFYLKEEGGLNETCRSIKY